jgi:phosphoglycolate phosphatase-like HAD superfamily hydrolase
MYSSFYAVYGEFRWFLGEMTDCIRGTSTCERTTIVSGNMLAPLRVGLGIASLVSLWLIVDALPRPRGPNALVLTRYRSLASLFLHETLAYVASIPNMVTFGIGVAQAYSTLHIGDSGWPRGNVTNLVVSVACWVWALWREYGVWRVARREERMWNSKLITRLHGGDESRQVLASVLRIGDMIELCGQEATPAEVRVIRVDGPREASMAAHCNREDTGEGVSRIVGVGDRIPAHRTLTAPEIRVRVEVVGLVGRTPCKGGKVPMYLDRARGIADGVGIALILGMAVSVAASAMGGIGDVDMPFQLGDALRHMAAAAISANILIPSMKMSLLYNIYNLLLAILYDRVRIRNYRVIPELCDIRSVTFDKTGTLTEEGLSVSSSYPAPKSEELIMDLANRIGWKSEEVKLAIIFANNETRFGVNRELWGTSPEEIEICRHEIPLELDLYNPLQTSRQASRQTSIQARLQFRWDTESPMRSVDIVKRHPYRFGEGKQAEIRIGEITLHVRQDGSSCIASSLDKETEEWLNEIQRSDPQRSMTIAWHEGEDGREHACVAYSFRNPLRPGVKETIEYFRKCGQTAMILTGDGKEAAEWVAEQAGFPMEAISDPPVYTAAGSHLQKLSDGELTTLLESPIPKVIYRAPRDLKGRMARLQSLMGVALYVGDAANDAVAIESASVGVCLRHGAAASLHGADVVIESPCDLVDILREGGYADRLVVGGGRLLSDVCWMGGLTAGCLVVGLHHHGFRYLESAPLFLDAWDPLPMLFLSSFQYSISVIAYSASECGTHGRITASGCLMDHIGGLVLGVIMGWGIRRYSIATAHPYGGVILYWIDLAMLCRHSLPCISSRGGGFSRSPLPSNNRVLGGVLNLLDSLPFRIILYGIYVWML